MQTRSRSAQIQPGDVISAHNNSQLVIGVIQQIHQSGYTISQLQPSGNYFQKQSLLNIQSNQIQTKLKFSINRHGLYRLKSNELKLLDPYSNLGIGIHQNQPAIPTPLQIQEKPTRAKKPVKKNQSNQPTSKITSWVVYSYAELLQVLQQQKQSGHIASHQQETCSICMCEFSPEDEGQIVRLGKCGEHFYHIECIEQCRGQTSFVRCPVCNIIYGTMTGNMPNGQMRVKVYKPHQLQLPGYEGFGAFEIHYSFPNGKRNGINYTGTNRTAFLPNSPEGQKVLNLLTICFERKLTFTVGTSVTTGRHNQVIWNGVHHKTSPSGGPTNFGYPDPTYLNRVTEELAMKGVY